MKKLIILFTTLHLSFSFCVAGELYVRTNNGNTFSDDCLVEVQSHSDRNPSHEYWINCMNFPVKENIILPNTALQSLVYVNGLTLQCPVELSIFGSNSNDFALQLDCREVFIKKTKP
jgi:hypothetical protein